MSTSSNECKCNYGTLIVGSKRVQCDNCKAPPVTDTIAFTANGADLHSTGWGIDTYLIGDGQDSMRLNRDEVRAVIAHMQAWLDKSSAVDQESETIASVKYKSTHHLDGTAVILTIVRIDGDDVYWCNALQINSPYAVEVTAVDGFFLSLRDLDGDKIIDRHQDTWEPIDASKVPADVILTVEKSWDDSDYTLVAFK